MRKSRPYVGSTVMRQQTRGDLKPKSKISSALKLYLVLISASIRSKMQYKFDFVANSLIQAVMGAYDFLFVAVILWKFRMVDGWNIYEIGLLFSVSNIGWGIYRVFCSELDRFETYIVRGEFDSVLIRPWPTLFVLLTRNIDLSRITWILNGVGVALISIPKLMRIGIFSWFDIGYFLLAVLWEGCLFAAVGLATASAAFWIVRVEELQVFTQNAPKTAVQYPLQIYPGWLKTVLLSVIPLGIGNYVPMVYLLEKGGTPVNLLIPAVVSPLALYFAGKLWHLGETRYHSTGS